MRGPRDYWRAAWAAGDDVCGTELVTLLALAHLAEPDGSVETTFTRLAAMARTTVKVVRLCIDALTEKHLVAVQRRGRRHRFFLFLDLTAPGEQLDLELDAEPPDTAPAVRRVN